MELYRKIEKDLNIWKEDEFGLLVYGPRQVGKTYILKSFLTKNFKSVCYLNLFNNFSAIKNIINTKNIDDFLMRLSLLCDIPINNETVIFVDEIQYYYTYLSRHKEIEEYFDIIYQVKTFVSERRNRIVLSGSLLRLELNSLITAPTGYLLPLEMYPLDFEEYLINSKVDQKIIDIAKNKLNVFQTVPEYIHEKFISICNEYMLVGGMPEAVSNFLENKDFYKLKLIHRKIEGYFLLDITQYVGDDEKLKVKEIYNLIPTELSNPSRKFIISDIPTHSRGNNEVLSFTWLNNAGITIPTYITNEPLIPLIKNSKRNQFKLFFEDVGLLSYRMFDSNTKLSILNNELKTNIGFIFENFVAQELHAHGHDTLYYYCTKKYGEVDFVLEKNQKIIPLEVKSGKSNNYHRALNNIMDIDVYDLKKAFVLSNKNVYRDGKIIYLPIYAISLMDFFTNEK